MPSELTRRAFAAGLTPDVADRIDILMAPVRDRQVAIRIENNIYVRAIRRRDFVRAERSAIRRALLDPEDHRPWLDVATSREGQGALTGALEALARARFLDGGAEIAARAARERMRMRLN
jgi:regulator of sirC expression with transglutaminase-like and TPR domain